MKTQHFYFVCILFFASIAALGNIPYGFRFAYTILPTIEPYRIVAGVLFATTATLANLTLGAYSLLNLYTNKTSDYRKILFILSFAGAIPMGFICFFGYRNLINNYLNLIISCTVSLVNGVIGYIALSALADNTKQLKKWLTNYQYLLKHFDNITMKTIGFLIGLGMSLVGYIAAANGMKLLFDHYGWSNNVIHNLTYIIAISTWIPFAALYANSTQQVFGTLYQQLSQFKKIFTHRDNKQRFSSLRIFLAIFALLSGSALTQIAVELFSPSNNLPGIFKQENVQMLINYFLIPMTFISVTAVNYLALNNFIQHVRTKI